MTNLKSNQEIKIMRQGGKILAKVINEARKNAQSGVSKLELDNIIEKKILSCGAKPSFKNYKGYKFASCLSLNSQIVHGLPDQVVLKNGDILGIDIGVLYHGYHTDCAITVGIGKISNEAKKLIDTTNKTLKLAIKMIKPGLLLGDLQKAMENYVEKGNYCLVRSFSGHGIGKNLQEEPIIPNYYGVNKNLVIKENAVFCLEPMLIIGKNPHVKILEDGWTAVSSSGNLAAHFEHTIAINKYGCDVLTAWD